MSWFRCCCGASTENDFDSVSRQSLSFSVSHPSEAIASRLGKTEEVSEGTVTIDHVEKEDSKPTLVSEVAALETAPVEKEVPSKPRALVLESEAPSVVSWVIGLDFGTTNSGFAFAQATGNPNIYCHYNWPRRGAEKPYCKTLTGLFYTRDASTGQLTCTSWGHPARSDYMQQKQRGEHLYLETLKLLVNEDFNDPELLSKMPPSLTPADLVSTYLKLIGEYALSEVERHHNKINSAQGLFRKDAVQWYVTVPSIWNENAKQQMKDCMIRAGLVVAGRINHIHIVLEPEAGSFYCHQVLREGRKDVSLNRNDKILVADVGGGTVDIVVQEMISNSENYKVKELTESSGGLCGGRYVDESFRRFLGKKIPCLEEFLSQRPGFLPRLLRSWEDIKSAFGHEEKSAFGHEEMSSWADTKDIDLPHELAERWEAACKNSRDHGDYSVVSLTEQDLKAIFDPVVDDILELIVDQLQRVPDIKVIFVVGGFAGSPYLMQRIRARFESQVKHIVSPPNPGSAIVYGAVLLALHPDAIVSRVSRKRS